MHTSLKSHSSITIQINVQVETKKMLHFTPEMHDTEPTRERTQQLHINFIIKILFYKLYVSNLEEQA